MGEDKKVKDASIEEIVDEISGKCECDCDCDHKDGESNDKNKIKNLISLAILLGGLFVGSLFVDVSQMVQGGGISKKILNDKDIFSLGEKTWVAYPEPIVPMEIINDEECEECNADETLSIIRKLIPTVLTSTIEDSGSEGENMIKELEIKTLPAFVFSKEIESTEFFAQAKPVFIQKGDKYVLNTAQLGIPAGKYVTLPAISENSLKYGNDDAKVKLVEFSDFQCPYCREYHKVIKEVIKNYPNDVQFVFKQLPLEAIHPNAMNAAMAVECANEQGKFIEYADTLFEDQDKWKDTTSTDAFKKYAAQLGLNREQFNTCLDQSKYADKINADMAEAESFGVSGTPAAFINGQFKSGMLQVEMLDAAIKEELEKAAESK